MERILGAASHCDYLEYLGNTLFHLNFLLARDTCTKHTSKNGTDRVDADVNDKVKIINRLLYWESKSGEWTDLADSGAIP